MLYKGCYGAREKETWWPREVRGRQGRCRSHERGKEEHLVPMAEAIRMEVELESLIILCKGVVSGRWLGQAETYRSIHGLQRALRWCRN